MESEQVNDLISVGVVLVKKKEDYPVVKTITGCHRIKKFAYRVPFLVNYIL